MDDVQLTNEYIRGLIEGEGSFTFHTNTELGTGGKKRRRKIPVFALQMHERDENLIGAIRDHLGVKNKIYNYGSKDFVMMTITKGERVYKRGHKSILYVRDLGTLKNIIIPFFYKRLKGYKGIQFMEWLEKMGSDPEVSPGYKLLYRLYKCGYYDQNPKFLD